MTKRVVDVRVKAREPLRSLSVAVSSTKRKHADVTKRFSRVREGVWRGRLRRGHELARGRNYLYLRVRTEEGELDVTVQSLTVATKRADLLALRRLRTHAKRAPLATHVALKGGRLRARLNGRNVTRFFERAGNGRLRKAELSVSHGLQYGRNRLAVVAYNPGDGSYERVTRRFRIKRDRPLADAGLDKKVFVGSELRLDGRKSRRIHRRAPLNLRWRVIEKPAGSKPTLKGAGTARPRLIADVHGRYTLALRAKGPRMRSTLDTVSVAAQPNVPPSGMPLTTNAPNPDNPDGAYGIELGGEFYPPIWGDAGGGPQLMVLDRATLAIKEQNGAPTQTFGASDTGVEDLQLAIQQLSSDELAIVIGGGRSIDLSSNGQQTLAGALGLIGAQVSQDDHPVLASGEWSVVGVPGMPQGQAYQLIGREQGSGARTGAMDGLLQLDAHDNYTFTWAPEYVTFDTMAPGSTAEVNQIQVGTETYPSWTIGEDSSGLQVIWLDADSLELEETATFFVFPCLDPNTSEEGCRDVSCDDPPPGGPPECFDEFAMGSDSWDMPDIAKDEDALVLMTTLQRPAAGLNSAWGFLTEPLAQFGANQYTVLNADGRYSFVGTNGLGDAGPNLGAEVASRTPRISGIFTRNRQGLLEPSYFGSLAEDGVPELTRPDLQQILAQPPEPYPAFDTAAEQAAEEYIAQLLQLELDPEYGIRANYWQDESIAWDVKQTELANLPACTTSPCDQGGRGKLRRASAGERIRGQRRKRLRRRQRQEVARWQERRGSERGPGRRFWRRRLQEG